VLPGTAQVDVRVDGASTVTLQAALWEAGTKGAPEPVVATAVAGETNLFNGVVWLFFSGSYGIHIRVEGKSGVGTVAVPLNSTALRPPTMSASLAALLIVLGVLLFVGAVWFVTVAAREGALEPGVIPSQRARVRARGVAVLVTVGLAAAIWAGKTRWQKMDAEFRANALYAPSPVSASVRTSDKLHLLQLSPDLERPNAPAWDTLVADHGKLMHLFLLRAPDFNVFAHLHPVRRDALNFQNVLPALPAGQYALYGEITHENGLSQTLVTNVTLPEPLSPAPQMLLTSNMLNEVFCQSPLTATANGTQPFALDADDSWHLNANATRSPRFDRRESPLMGGLKMVFQNQDELVENRQTLLRFALFKADDEPAPLQPYMGMSGHCVIRRSDGAVFTHLHPLGTISMAAQQALMQREGVQTLPATNSIASGVFSQSNETTFPYAFPRSGNYRLWVQVRRNGRVLTGVFDVEVKPAK
jgi:hypothetical protein